MQMLFQLDQDVRNKIGHVVGKGFDKSAKAQDARVKVGQLHLVQVLRDLLELVGLSAGHLRPDPRTEVFEQSLLCFRVQKL